MIQTLIVDDEPLACEIIKKYLSEYADFQIVAICHDGFEAMKILQKEKIDLMFLDIQMPKISGLELLELLESPPAVIFSTAFDQYALQAFDAQAIDYLLKPFTKDRFAQAIGKFKTLQPQEIKEIIEKVTKDEFLDRIVVKVRNEIKIIELDELKFIEANDDFVNFHTAEGKFIKNRTMSFYEKKLNPRLFVRVHRSYMINVKYVTKIEAYGKDSHIVVLKTGEKVNVSKSGYPKLKAVLGL